jgi:hypothetical protein
MPTTVRVEDDVKLELDRLQGLVQAETGERLTHSALLARLVRVARRHESEIYTSKDAGRRRDAAAIRARLAKLAIDIGPSDVRDIDAVLYEERP